jgi:hypothetical protein
MAPLLWRCARASVACLLVVIFTVPHSLAVQIHLVSPEELNKATIEVAQVRRQNIRTIQQFLASDRAEKALKSVHMNPQKIQQAVPGLSDQELAQLASRASKAQADLVAGTISDRDLILILVGIAALILIIVAVR